MGGFLVINGFLMSSLYKCTTHGSNVTILSSLNRDATVSIEWELPPLVTEEVLDLSDGDPAPGDSRAPEPIKLEAEDAKPSPDW